MKIKTFLLIALFLFSSIPTNSITNTFKVAYTQIGNSNLVIVLVNKSFFYGNEFEQARWFAGFQRCVRSGNLNGDTVLISDENGKLRFYAPNSWHNFLRSIDINWVKSRVNKQLTCSF